MIGPAILTGRLIEMFREHLLNFNYYHIIKGEYRVVNYEIKKLNVDGADSIIESFIGSNIPIVCLAGSKSTVPFYVLYYKTNGIKFEVIENKTILYKADEELIN